ncbi:CRISPR-associated endonuclease Cas2 [Candidatus Kaiserbacteria bacterium RIFCSPHIGHO2_02_FULL_49_16]|uniref:CRISPR-associated endoribonuclease Cas2 n=1 Tax=Candidatus Kaiserbacteria bacterium RIFCSPHIGHO2_02_FULL_49_16 TaxID=1798490 RepID=A0A1F6DE83_9BACT|nr:MAG: CRISPR-associated endonuclease Cas2 [Candidatus Kaiserbacteria bacterium RIFCSPHIGHO2_02_FULL_49_16]
MGNMESESRKRTKRNQLRKIILETIKAVGFLSVALVVPNVLGAMYKMGLIASPQQKSVVESATKRLVRTGLLKWRNKRLRLTRKGEQKLRTLTLSEYTQKIIRAWDKKWRILIFDIPERRKGLRKKIRNTLQAIGFVRLQDSVWVYPYDCEDLITLLKADLRVGDDMLYIIVDVIERDAKLRRRFGI